MNYGAAPRLRSPAGGDGGVGAAERQDAASSGGEEAEAAARSSSSRSRFPGGRSLSRHLLPHPSAQDGARPGRPCTPPPRAALPPVAAPGGRRGARPDPSRAASSAQ